MSDLTLDARWTERSAYRPWPFVIDSIELRFELDPERTLVHNRMQMRRAPSLAQHPKQHPALRLDGCGLELISLTLDGQSVEPHRLTRDDEGLTITGVPERLELEIVTALAPRANQSGAGLFELKGQLATQCEPQGLRRITYCADRPDVLARYRVTLIADAERYPLLLSNGNQLSSRTLEDGRLEVIWDDPYAKPSYIFALVAGDLACLRDEHVTPSGRKVRLSLYADQRFIERCRFAMDALKRSMRWDETTYGLECDLDDYQVVALQGFVGAMENKGLNIFDISGIVADPEITTDDEALTIERIIAHEYFHNWTGNRVTCRDWFQLSLKEGLTRFRDQCYIDDLLPGGSYRIDMVRQLQRNQFAEDDGPERHAVRPERYATVEQFYTPTVYDKGAELIRMLHRLLGGTAFHAGVALYLRRHDGQAVTTDDFVVAMEAASGRDLLQFRRWYTQAGRPIVRAESAHDVASGRYVLTLTQSLPESAHGPFHIPVALQLFSNDGSALQKPQVLELTQRSQAFVFEGIAEQPLPSLLETFSAPVSIETGLGDDALARLLTHATDSYARWNAAQTLLVRRIRALAAAHHADAAMTLDDAFVDAFARVVERAAENRMLTADLLRIPDEPVLSEGLPAIDLDGHHVARQFLRCTLARRLRRPLRALLEVPSTSSVELLDIEGMGRRRLAGVVLDLLMSTGDSDIADHALQQVLRGATMTEQHAALATIADHDGPQRDQALAAFIERWQGQPTVVNKWFTAQALSRLPGTVDRVISLESHPAFSINDVTQVMALHGSFFRQNRIAFHDPSGRGYIFLADRLVLADRMGRAGAGWLLPQITQWRRHEPLRRELMRQQLQRVADTPGISNGLRGLMARALNESENP